MSLTASVSPLDVQDDKDGGDEVEDDDEGLEEFEGEALERIKLGKEGKFMRKLLGPKLPSQEEVTMHYLMGHVNYRSWCEICVRACGKEWDHRRKEDQEKEIS